MLTQSLGVDIVMEGFHTGDAGLDEFMNRFGDRNSFAFGKNQAIYSIGIGFSY